jgi:hypothetical protein
MRFALTLMEQGLVRHEQLRAWATQKATEVLQALVMWTSGEVYFEEEASPPPDRLLVALSVSSLLSVLPTSVHTEELVESYSLPDQPPVAQPQRAEASRSSIISTPTLTDAAQFFQSHDVAITPALSINEALLSIFTPDENIDTPPTAPAQPDVLVIPGSVQIDTSFMRPEMVLVPGNLSAMGPENLQIQLKQEHWLVLRYVDGQTSLQAICQELQAPTSMFCQAAGDLMALGVLNVVEPGSAYANEVPQLPAMPAMLPQARGYAPVNAAAMQPPWLPSPSMPLPDAPSQYSPILPFETRSQWGNGNNGASFIPGRGWITAPLPAQPKRQEAPLRGGYVSVGSER